MQCYEKNTFINANYLYKSMLRIMRNEIYARHGYNFASAGLKKYFSKQKWYKPVKSNSEVKLSEVEQYNVDIIKMIENKRVVN